ncbi:hypothetical protein PC118_g19897 [Phytophthora cactorum]|uniref:Uncharacterized protein n=1 Tax=Phytophthora cactorum TaxID=29920 RepID=A0A8T1F766_9STRA|nr:hypothetical protein PC118_g19897 [Phytophthora cactorum]
MSATQLASVTKVLVRAMVQRPRSSDQGFWYQFNRAQTVEEVGSAITAGTEQVFDTSGDVGKLRARLDSAYAGRQALEVKLLTQTGLRENAELFARQATAEIEELKAELKRAKDSDAARLRRCMDAQVSLDASTKTTEKLRQFIKSIQESTFRSRSRSTTSKLHRLLSDLIKGDSSDVQAMQSKVAVQRDQIHRLTRTNGILRQQKPGKRRRLRRAGSSSELSPSPSSDSEDSKRRQCKPSGSPKAALAAAVLADVPSIASDPSPSKRRDLRMPKAWRKTKPAKKRRAASGPIAVFPKDRPVFKTTDPRLRGSPAAAAAPSSPSPSPIIPSVAAPASRPSLAVTEGPAQASLSTGDSRAARTVSQPAPTDVSIVVRRAASPGEDSALRTSSVTGPGTVAGTSVKVGLHLYLSSMFSASSHAAASSSVPASVHSPASLSDPSPRERARPSRQSSQRSQFKSSLLAEQEAASTAIGDVEEKTEDVTVDSPVQEVPSSQSSGRVLSLTPGSGPVIRLSSEASLADDPIPVLSQAPLQTPSDTSAAPLTHSRPGVVIVSTFTPGFDPRSTIPSSDIPVPVHGVQPIVRSSAKLPSSTNPIVDLRFHKSAAQRCWFAIICARVPTPIGGQAVASCGIEGIIAFANFADANHPFQAYLRSLPDRSSIFDSSGLDIDMVISRRAPLTLRYFHLWRRLRGQTSNTTQAIASWERHHWVANSAVERMIRAMFRDPSFNKEVVKAILQQWKDYIKFRKQRADVLWIHHKRSFQSEGLVDEQDKAEGVKESLPS